MRRAHQLMLCGDVRRMRSRTRGAAARALGYGISTGLEDRRGPYTDPAPQGSPARSPRAQVTGVASLVSVIFTKTHPLPGDAALHLTGDSSLPLEALNHITGDATSPTHVTGDAPPHALHTPPRARSTPDS